jgi:DNA-binding LytR/AlgR family response regulator
VAENLDLGAALHGTRDELGSGLRQQGTLQLRLHKHREYISELTLVHLEQRLDPTSFVRIHRSSLVNESCIMRLIEGVPAMVELANGMRLELSRRNRGALKKRLRGEPTTG